MLPVIYDMGIYRGDAFSKRLRFTSDGVPEDLTGKPVLAQIRTSTELTAKLVATFTISRQDALGVIDISLNPTEFNSRRGPDSINEKRNRNGDLPNSCDCNRTERISNS